MTFTRDPFPSRRTALVGLAGALVAPAIAKAAGKVVTVLGDSITAGYGLSAADALPAQLAARLKGVQVRAAGVSGDTSADALARVDFSVQSDTTLCLVEVGANDLLQGLEPRVLQANLQAIVRRLKARRIGVLIAGMQAPPSLGRSYARDYDAVFPTVAREEHVALYPFLLSGVALDGRLNQKDGIHPNANGVKVIAGRLAPVVAHAVAAHP